jgi:mevalonate kinase
MLLGEHAVLYGRHALVAAVNQRLHVTMAPREDQFLRLHSQLGEHETTFAELTDAPWCRFIIAACRRCRGLWPGGGADLWFESDFSDQLGLGSSAAVTAATLAALYGWAEREPQPDTLFREGLRVILDVQGAGSGADLAASVYGGVLLYRTEPFSCERIAATLPLAVVYSGQKVSTVDIVAHVAGRQERLPGVIDTVFDAMDVSALIAAETIRRQDWATLGELLNVNQGLMESLGVSTSSLLAMLEAMRACPGVFGAKLSGAGMGDCLVGIGELPAEGFPHEALPIAVDPQGVIVEA